MKTRNLIPFAVVAFVMLTFSACKKENDTDPIVSAIEQEAEIDSFMDEIVTEVDELTHNVPDKMFEDDAAKSGGQGTRVRVTSWDGNCRVDSITYTNYVNPNARFERVKNGLIVIRTCGGYTGTQFERTMTFSNFTINGNLIEGVKTITKTGEYTFSITLTNGQVTFTDGTTYTRTVNRTRTWISGYNTPLNVWDDVYTLEGTATGVNRNGKTYTHQITSALIYRLNCAWIVQGIVRITVDSREATIDYGNGQCDNIATITINGKTHEIRLRGGRN